MTPQYRWTYDPDTDIWTKGGLRVSGAFLSAYVDFTKPVAFKHKKAVTRLAQSVLRPKPERATLTREAKRRILDRIRAAGRLTIGSAA